MLYHQKRVHSNGIYVHVSVALHMYMFPLDSTLATVAGATTQAPLPCIQVFPDSFEYQAPVYVIYGCPI